MVDGMELFPKSWCSLGIEFGRWQDSCTSTAPGRRTGNVHLGPINDRSSTFLHDPLVCSNITKKSCLKYFVNSQQPPEEKASANHTINQLYTHLSSLSYRCHLSPNPSLATLETRRDWRVSILLKVCHMIATATLYLRFTGLRLSLHLKRKILTYCPQLDQSLLQAEANSNIPADG